MATVIIKNLTKKFGKVIAVKDFSLDIKHKEFCVFVGPSGCGKSTTLRAIVGLEEITEGEIWIDDVLVNDIPPKDRNIAMVFQNYALYPHMNVFENMAFGLKLRGYDKVEIDEKIKKAADVLGIKSLLKRVPKALSGGQRQRVALGRAIVRNPKVFLFDEPLSNLDAKLRVQMRMEIKKLHIKLQATTVYVTHDQVEAMTLGDKIVIMKDGIVQQVSDTLTIYNKPVNKFVAGFIGSPPMNFINGSIVKKNDSIWFKEKTMEVKIPDEHKKVLINYINKEVIFGIRAEDIYDRLYTNISMTGNTVMVKVDIVECLGSEKLLYLKTGENNFITKVKIQNQAIVNQTIEVVFDMEKMHIFDKETEKAIM